MGFAQHIDYPAGNSTVGSAYTAGAGSITLATGDGSKFGTPTATNPLRFTVASAAAPSTCTHYQATGISTDTLTGVTVLSGTDRNYSIGDTVYSSIYAEDLNDLQSGIGPITVNSGAFDFSTGNWFTRTLNGSNGTITVANLTPGKRVRIDLTQDGTGSHAVTWSIAGALYPGGTAPVQTTTAMATDIYEVDCPSAGTVYVYAVKQNIAPVVVTWTHVQGTSARVATGNVVATLNGVAAGNLLVVGVDNNAFRPAWTVGDTVNTYSTVKSQNDPASGGCQLSWTQASTSGNLTITGSTGGGYSAITVDEFHPSVAGTIVLDNANGGNGAASPASSGNVTISGTNSVVVCILQPDGPGVSGGGANTPSSGYTLGQSIPTPSSGNIGIASSYKLNVGTGPEDPGWTEADNNKWACVAASFKVN